MPVAESQVRPLVKIKDPEQQAAAWTKAVELAEDSQPTARDAKEAVLEILPPEGEEKEREPRGQKRKRILESLKRAIHRGCGRERLEEIIAELEELI